MRREISPEASQLSKIFQDASLPIIIEDLEGRVTAMNPAAELAYGWSNEELIGLPIKTIVPSERHEQADDLLRRCKSGEIVRDIESVRVSKDGKEVPVLLTLSLLRNVPETELRIASMATDISSLKAAENELRAYHDQLEARVLERTAELESTLEELALARSLADRANLAKSQFLANMSHEIRTPMNAIVGMTHLLLQSELSKRQRGFLGKIQESSRTLLRLVNDILDFSKIEAHKLELESREFDLDQLMEQQAGLFVHSAWEKGLKLRFHCDSQVPRLLRGDSLRIGQILTNLLANAIKFTEMGEVCLRVEAQKLQEQKYRYEFRVEDSGIGIESRQLSELFESFQQADSSITRRYGGTGLGLAICKQLTELMGGEIGVESSLGLGSQFWVRLELEAFLDRRQKSVSSQRVAGLVNCGFENSQILQDYLQASGWSWSENDDPYEFSNASLVFVEESQLHRPRSREVLQEFASHHPAVKIVVLSQHLDLEIRESAPDYAYLPLPLILRGFREFLHELFELEHPSQELEQEQLDSAFRPGYEELKVLVVEDHPINREVLSEFLCSVGAQVAVAVNGELACQIAAEEEFDLIFMDIQMPVMDGIAATKCIRETGFDRPIVAVTANVSTVEQQRYLSAGMDGFLGKPLEPRQLFDCLASFTSDKGVLDYSFGLDSLRGNADLYHRMLGDFFEEMKSLEKRFNEAPHDDERKRLAHSLVGVAGTLGLHEMSSKARELEANLDPEILAEVLSCYQRVRASYKRQERRGVYSDLVCPVQRVAVSEQAVQELERLLHAGDAEALNFAASLEPRTDWKDWPSLLSQIEDFEFDEALETLAQWIPE